MEEDKQHYSITGLSAQILIWGGRVTVLCPTGGVNGWMVDKLFIRTKMSNLYLIWNMTLYDMTDNC